MKLTLESRLPCNVKFSIKIKTPYIPRNKLERCLHLANISDSGIDTNFGLTHPHSHMEKGHLCLRNTKSVTVTPLEMIATVTGRAQSPMAVSFEVDLQTINPHRLKKSFLKSTLLLVFRQKRSIKRNKLNNKENSISSITLKPPSLQVFCLNLK